MAEEEKRTKEELRQMIKELWEIDSKQIPKARATDKPKEKGKE